LKAVAALCLSLFLFTLGAARAGAAPSLVYSVNQGWEDVAVDSAGNAYVLIDHYVAKLSPQGQLIFERQVDLRSQWPVAIAVDPAGYIYIAGTGNFADPSEVGSGVNEAYEAFVAKVSPDATSVLYETFYSERDGVHGIDLGVDTLGRPYLLYQPKYDGFMWMVGFDSAGSYRRWVASPSYTRAMAVGPAGDLFTVGWELNSDASAWELQLIRTDASSGAVIQTLVDDSQTIDWYDVDMAATPGRGAVVTGRKLSGLYHVAEIDSAGEKVFARDLNLGAAEIHDVAVTSSGQIVLVGRIPGSRGWDAYILRLEGGTGEVVSSMTLGGSSHDRADWVAPGPGGDLHVGGYTSSPDFPAVNSPRPFPGMFLARITENRPPDCSGAMASPSVIWPPNGKMVTVSVLRVADPDGDPVALKVTGITQDEPGAAFSGIGSSVARVKAERDGKGDGRVYRIELEAADPSGASCTGKVTVCVPHDSGKGSCVDDDR
jgi:hypothetical protein